MKRLNALCMGSSSVGSLWQFLAWIMQSWWGGPAWSPFGNFLHGSCNLGFYFALVVWEFSIGSLCYDEVPCFLQCDDDYSSFVMMKRALLPWFTNLGRQSNAKATKELFCYACFYGLCLLLVGKVVAILPLLGLLSPAWHVSFIRWWHPFCFLLIGLLSLALCSISGCVGTPSVI